MSDGAGQQLAYNPPNDKRVERILKPPPLMHLLQRFCDAATLPARRSAFIAIIRWTRKGNGASGELTRLVQLLDILESDAELRAGVQQSLGKLLAEIDSLALFAEVGLPSVHPFTTEIVRRLVGRVLPSARRDRAGRLVVLFPMHEVDHGIGERRIQVRAGGWVGQIHAEIEVGRRRIIRAAVVQQPDR